MSSSPIDQSLVVAGVQAGLPVSDDATTSRTTVNNEAFRVVVFAMDAGQELTDHAAGRPVTVLIGEGDVRVTVDGDAHELAAGDIVYLAPGARHAVLARTACRFTLVMASPAGHLAQA